MVVVMVVVVWYPLIMISPQSKLSNSGLYWTGLGFDCPALHCSSLSILNTNLPNQTKHITAPGSTVLLYTALHFSKPAYTDPKSNHMVWCGGGVVQGGIKFLTSWEIHSPFIHPIFGPKQRDIFIGFCLIDNI